MYAGAMSFRLAPACLVLATCTWACESTGAEAESSPKTTSVSESGESGETGECEIVPMIDHSMWQDMDPLADPLADHRPDPVACTIAGWFEEDDHLEVDTNQCNYVALVQPSLADMVEGENVELILYHFDLIAPEQATAHIAIMVDGQLLWEQDIAIPGDAGYFDLDFPAPFSAPRGSEVVFHLHNHGQNTWTLQDLGSCR